MTARHRISKLLLRQGIVYYEGKTWTGRHELWLRKQRFDNPALQLTYDAAFDAMTACVDRRERLEAAIEAMAADSEFTPVVQRLGCIRGIATLTAFGLAAEIGDWHRLTGRTIGAYLGLVPSEYSSGDSRVQGSVTKTGNGHARRLLVEAAGITAARTDQGPCCGAAGSWLPRPLGPVAKPPTGACISGGSTSICAGNDPWSPTWPWPGNWPAGAGHWPCSRSDQPTLVQMRTIGGDGKRLGVTRESSMSNPVAQQHHYARC